MKIGEVFRYSRPYSPEPEMVQGHRNYFHATRGGAKLALLDKGINPLEMVRDAPEGVRRPAILVSSSPHKIGSVETPWQDVFDVDNGRLRYFGDNKSQNVRPEDAPGNRALIEAYRAYDPTDRARRAHAIPILAFRRVSRLGRAKGFVEFQGVGVIERIELVTQYDSRSRSGFSNYSFDIAILSLVDENEDLNWDWINARKNPGLTLEETLRYAPRAWREAVNTGPAGLERCRRRRSCLSVVSETEQKPQRRSREEGTLRTIYEFYNRRKVRFEALAAAVAARVLGERGSYRQGWITPGSSDHGVDFVGRLDVGSGFAKTKIVVLGQAKCEKPSTPTGGNHLARTVARLRRGWIGVYVTTSYFSRAVQMEVIEDQYPLVLIHGLRLAQEVQKLAFEQGQTTVRAILEQVDARYDSMIRPRKPEEVLLD